MHYHSILKDKVMCRYLFIGDATLSVEITRAKLDAALEVGIGGDENELKFHVAIPFLFQVWFQIRWFKLGKWLHLPFYETRMTGFHFFYPLLVFQIWQREMSWSKGDWQWIINIKDLIYGSATYSEHDSSEVQDIVISMPEKDYAATARTYTGRWTRRWKVQEVKRVEVDIPEGIPHPGKGTTSYNLDDDALFGGTYPCETIDDAIAKVIESVNYCRENYPL